MKALIITDQASIAFGVLQALEEIFTELQVCNTVEAAKRLKPEFVPDLIVVTDQVSPVRPAASVARDAGVGATPVIMLTTGLSAVTNTDPSCSVRIEPPLTPIRARMALERLGLCVPASQSHLPVTAGSHLS